MYTINFNKKKGNKWPYAFIAPYFLFYITFGLFPIIFTLYISFTNWDGLKKGFQFVGFDNYIQIFMQDMYFLKSIGNTVVFMLISIPLILGISLILAALLYSPYMKGKRFFQTVNFLPYITIPVAIGLMFSILFDWKVGFINNALIGMGILDEGINWLGQPFYARVIVALMITWKNIGYSLVIYLAGMSSISKELYEAARVDGAAPFRIFFKITVPLLRPVIIFLVITNIIGGFKLFDEPMLLLNGFNASAVVGGPNRSCLTAVWYLYDTAFGSTMKYGKASAIAYGLFMFISGFSLISFKLMNRKEKI